MVFFGGDILFRKREYLDIFFANVCSMVSKLNQKYNK